MTAIEKVINLAKSEVGYLEKSSNAYLDEKTKNAGYNNWTKYARDLDNLGFYNTKKNGFPWCDIFFDWLLYKCFGLDMLMKMTGQPKGAANSGAGCGDSMYFYRQINRVFSTPEPGDQIFFWNSTKSAKAHTGLVVKVENGKVYTIEGNTSSTAGVVANGGGVFEKSYDLNYSRIAGYGRPRYDLVDESDFKLIIDISSWQKGLDLSKAKAEGVSGVILRCADGNTIDNQFEYFYNEAEKNNIPVGCYIFSRATTIDDAEKEAMSVNNMLIGKNIQLPVYIDCECDAQKNLGKSKLTDIILKFVSTIKKDGHTPGIYTTEYWFNNYIDMTKVSAVEKWIAKWSKTKPSLECGMWQFGGETNYIRSNKIAGYVVDQSYMLKNYLEDAEVRYYKLKDITNIYYRPTIEKLLSMGVCSKGGSGEETIIDLSEDAIRILCILDKLGKFDELKQESAEQIIAEIGKILIKS